MDKLALVGYGKMGRLMDSLTGEFGFKTVLRLDEFNNANGSAMTVENFHGVDVAIEFSTPHVVVGNIESLAKLGVSTVVGTTGWNKDLEHVRQVIAEAGNGF